jgi:hypothetical protein
MRVVDTWIDGRSELEDSAGAGAAA